VVKTHKPYKKGL